jgi:hypothetical protein
MQQGQLFAELSKSLVAKRQELEFFIELCVPERRCKLPKRARYLAIDQLLLFCCGFVANHLAALLASWFSSRGL